MQKGQPRRQCWPLVGEECGWGRSNRGEDTAALKHGEHVTSSQPLGVRLASPVGETPDGDGVLRTFWRDALCYREQKSLGTGFHGQDLHYVTLQKSGAGQLFQGLPVFVLGFSLCDQCPSWLQDWLQQLQASHPYISNPEAGKRDCSVSDFFLNGDTIRIITMYHFKVYSSVAFST